jgi:hypothetical protein
VFGCFGVLSALFGIWDLGVGILNRHERSQLS